MDRERQQTIDKLNNILTGENMAVKIYERFLKKLPETTEKVELVKFNNDHQKHAKELTDRVQVLGGRPSTSVGVMGILAAGRASLKTIIKTDIKDIAKQLYEGEKMGIAISKDISEGELDMESTKLVERILAEDSAHLERLEKLLH